jgi:hypothetical protein
MRAQGVTAVVFLTVVLATSRAGAQSDGEGDVVDVPPGDEYADTDPSALSDFRPALDPYGSWADDPTYGMVWTPSSDQVAGGFQPYDTAGSWDYVDGDYTWVSDYAWGWVCFHYGRWAFSAGRWVWIPGRDYAGAWVSWRTGDDGFGYLGWAPMAPSWIWMGGAAMALGFASSEPWVFSTYGEVFAPNTSSHVVTGSAAANVATHTKPYVASQPSVSGGGPQPAPHGPPPASLGIDVSHLSFPALSSREVRARQLGRPSTAQPLGAHAPVRHVVRPAPRPGATRVLGESRAPVRGRR